MRYVSRGVKIGGNVTVITGCLVELEIRTGLYPGVIPFLS